eukprot:1195047-Prorocentrum_minimum.AAC.5
MSQAGTIGRLDQSDAGSAGIFSQWTDQTGYTLHGTGPTGTTAAWGDCVGSGGSSGSWCIVMQLSDGNGNLYTSDIVISPVLSPANIVDVRARITTHHNASQHITTHHSISQRITTHHNASQRITTHHNASQHSTRHSDTTCCERVRVWAGARADRGGCGGGGDTECHRRRLCGGGSPHRPRLHRAIPPPAPCCEGGGRGWGGRRQRNLSLRHHGQAAIQWTDNESELRH